MLWRKLVQPGYPQYYPQLILMLTNDFTDLAQIFLTVIHKDYEGVARAYDVFS